MFIYTNKVQMSNKSIAAQYVITNTGKPLKNGVVTYNEESKEIISVTQLTKEIANTEHYNGVLIPSYVNAHCHLELCHLKNKVTSANSLIDFLYQMFKMKGSSYDYDATQKADQYMYYEGVSAVGDIGNTADTAEIKSKSNIRYINFVELIGTTHDRCINDTVQYNDVFEKFTDYGLNEDDIVAVPHSPYFVSPELFDIINDINRESKKIISIHNQETFAENLLYQNKTGDFINKFPLDLNPIPVTGKTSLQSMSQLVKANYERILLVHNIYTSEEDAEFAKQNFKHPYFVICPKSNLNLEKRIADVNMLQNKKLNICIGTDSLSSNDKLSMLEEMRVLQKYHEYLSLEEIVKFATLNGAEALGLDSELGKIEPGKHPGLVLLENIDLQNLKFTDKTTSRRLL